jgi:hypothetical protein
MVIALLLWAPSASATEIGSTCPAAQVTTLNYLVERMLTGSHLQTTTAPGVITKWKVNTIGTAVTTPTVESLAIIKEVKALEGELVALGEPETVDPGKLNEFAARVPFPAGVLIGVHSDTGIPFCAEVPGDEFIYSNVDLQIGEKKAFGNILGGLVAMSAVIEPDADGDGYGDETQDFCPTNPFSQCLPSAAGSGSSPAGGSTSTTTPAKLAITTANLEGNTVAVKLSASAAAQVTVTGSIRGKSAAPAATVAVTPGATGRAYLTLSKATRERLAKLPRKAHLTLVIEAQSAGSVPVSSELALPGRKKAHRKHHRTRAVTKALASLPKARALQVKVTAAAANLTGKPTTSVSRTKLRGNV